MRTTSGIYHVSLVYPEHILSIVSPVIDNIFSCNNSGNRVENQVQARYEYQRERNESSSC